MPIQKYEVSLSATERTQLTKIVKSGTLPARTILRANILLAVDRNGKHPMTVQEAAIAYNTSAVNRNEQCNIFRNEGCNVFGSNRATFSEAIVQRFRKQCYNVCKGNLFLIFSHF